MRNWLRLVLVSLLTVFGAGLASQSGFVLRAADYGGYRPHYQGYGVNTPGGRGGSVCRVTSVSDASPVPGPNTLRYCLERVTGPRFVVFETSGTVQLEQGPLRIRSPFVTIAGQTAPSPGIVIRGPGIIIDTRDVVIQHVRVRVGNIGGEPVAVWVRDDATNVVIDHVSVSWSVWTSVAVSALTHGHPPGDVTILDSLIAEPLACSGVNTAIPCRVDTYPRAGSSNSRAVGIGDAWHHGGPRVTFLRNVIAHSNDRHPETGGGSQTFLVNNLVYNPSLTPMSTLFYADASGVGPLFSVAVGNVLVPGPTTPGHKGYVAPEYRDEGELRMVRVHPTVNPDSRIYLEGNYYANDCQGSDCLASPASQWMLAKDFKLDWEGVNIRATAPPIELENLPLSSVLPYGSVEPYLTANAGARPLDRDPVDARIVAEIAMRSGRIINSTADVAGPGTGADGFPILAVTRRTLSVPANPHQVVDAVGRTRIERWLEDFARELEPVWQLKPAQ